MTSFNFSVAKRRRTYVRLIGDIREQLHKSLDEENAARQLTQQGMADALNTSKSFISRKMNGTSNMTLETLADLAYALDRVVNVELRSRLPKLGSNFPRLEPKSYSTSDSPAKVKVKQVKNEFPVELVVS